MQPAPAAHVEDGEARGTDGAVVARQSLRFFRPFSPKALAGLLERPHSTAYIVVLSLLLLAPCLGARLLMDDYVLALRAAPDTRIAAMPSEPLSAFTFTTGDPQRNGALMDEGVLLPWWTQPQHLNAFLRPLSALTHALDFRLWPQAVPLMHLHSLVWFALLLWWLGRTYRALEPEAPLLATLALCLYAIDDAHGPTVGWVANRNAVIAAALSLPALVAHHRAVTEGLRAGFWRGAAWLALGLLAGETALCVFGYVLAYAICRDRRVLRSRALSLVPYLLVLLAHRLVYRQLHLGSFGSSAYHDPLNEPLAFARMLGFNLPVLLSAQLFVPIADIAFWGNVRGQAALWSWAVLSLVAITALCWPVLRREASARFWALGMLLSAIPVSASLPGERLLLVVSIGAAPLLARVFLRAWSLSPQGSAHAEAALASPASGAPRMLLGSLVLLHLVVAPCSLPLRAYSFELVGRHMDRLESSLPTTADIRERTVVVLNAPVNIMLSYLQLSRAARAVPRPRHLYWLSSGSSPTEVLREDRHSLRVTQAAGFLLRPEETHYRADVHDLPVGTAIERADMHIEIAASTPDGRPASVLFRFAEPLESARYAFYVYRTGQLVPWQPVAQHAREQLPAYDFFELVAREALR